MKKWEKKEITEKLYITGGKRKTRNAATKDKSWLFAYLMLSSNSYCVPHAPDAQWFKNRLGEGRGSWGSKHSTSLPDCSLSKRTPARTWPKPPAALMEARTYLPVFMEVVSSLKHVNPAWKKSVLRRDSQSRQQPDTLTLIRSEF